MRTTGIVRAFDDEQGWGVIDSPVSPGGCWVSFADVRMAGYRTLRPGETVTLDLEAVRQDAYAFRATAVWPDGIPVESEPVSPSETGGAYGSRLVITDRGGAVLHDGGEIGPESPGE